MKKTALDHQLDNDPVLTNLANKMATMFEKNITASKLAEWVGISSRQLQHLSKEESESGAFFLSSINSWLLPELIECKDKEARLIFLQNELPDFMGTDDNKIILHEIGQGFLSHIKKYSICSEDVTLFMDIFRVFILLAGIYSTYEYKEDQLRKAA